MNRRMDDCICSIRLAYEESNEDACGHAAEKNAQENEIWMRLLASTINNRIDKGRESG